MAPKKKLSKKEKARLEAEQAEMLRIEMEKEKQKKREELRQRKEIEREQAKRRQKEEVKENKVRRAQLKDSMKFFNAVQEAIGSKQAAAKEQHEWEKYMRCNRIPDTSSPAAIRTYLHQWRSDSEARERDSRNWLLQTDERSLLTQDTNAVDLSQAALRARQINIGDVYAERISEVLAILDEMEESLEAENRPSYIIEDLIQLKKKVRISLNEYVDQFSYKIMSHIERDMEIDRPGVSKHIYVSDVFKTHTWTYSKDAQISANPKSRIVDPNQHNDVDFPTIELQITLPPVVQLPSSALRGLWLNYDHYSDYCPTYSLKRPRRGGINILHQTKKEWRKRKEILQSMLDDCSKDIQLNVDDSLALASEQAFDVDKLYTEYEDELGKARRRAIGPESFNMAPTDVNLRKYRIIGGVYCIDHLEVPLQDKQLNARSFIRMISTPDELIRKNFHQTYKPPPAAQPGMRRLPEEIEAEMRMIEAALDKLALVTLQLPDSVIWFEPPIACRWETSAETREADLIDASKPPTTATPTEITPQSTTTNLSPLKTSPRFPASMRRKRCSHKLITQLPNTQPIREITDFDMFNIPDGIDIYTLVKDFVVPRLPTGFRVRLETPAGVKFMSGEEEEEENVELAPKQRLLFLARHKNVKFAAQSSKSQIDSGRVAAGYEGRESDAGDGVASTEHEDIKEHGNGTGIHLRYERINEDFLDLKEPRPLFQMVNLKKILKFKEGDEKTKTEKEANADENTVKAKPKLLKKSSKKELNESMSEKSSNATGSRKISFAESGNNTESRRCSKENERVEEKEAVLERKRTYMFSELIRDLDHLRELQMPLQQQLALNQIAANLSCSGSTIGTQDDANKSKAGDEAELTESQADLMQPTFSYYAGMSFVRDALTKQDSEDKMATEAQGSDDESDESSSIYDEDKDDDDEFYLMTNERQVAGVANGDKLSPRQQQQQGNLNSVTMSTGGAQSKHNQSRKSNTSSDGIEQKLSHFASLTQGKWSARDVHDTKFNEEKLSIQFRTGRLGIFGFALNRYSNMPYQTWEIRPDFKSPGTVFFSFTASIISLDITISAAGYCMNNFQGGTTEAINEMIGKTMSLEELKAMLIASAVDIFPDEDAFCYTEGSCEKNYVMEMHLYACMSTLALSHNFSWSRWNLLAGSRTAVLLMRELIEGKKVPYHSTLLVTPLKTAIIECTEVSASFNSASVAGMGYYADLYQLSQEHILPSSLEKQHNMEPVLRDNVARILMAIRPLSFC